MDCTLCKKPIKGYNPAYNHLKIDESNSADICSECVDKFGKWQQGIFADLFPTKAAKKRFGRI
jgi:ribosome-binding protein aMBF1 (putative translation factor)